MSALGRDIIALMAHTHDELWRLYDSSVPESELRKDIARLTDKWSEIGIHEKAFAAKLIGAGVADAVTHDDLRNLIMVTMREFGSNVHESAIVERVALWITTEAQAAVRRALRSLLVDGTLQAEQYTYNIVERPLLPKPKIVDVVDEPTEAVAADNGTEPVTRTPAKPPKPPKPRTRTGPKVKEAARMWKEGYKLADIAEAVETDVHDILDWATERKWPERTIEELA